MGPLQDGNRMTGSLFDWPVVAREAPEVAPPSVPTMAPTMKLPPAPLPPDVESSGRHGEPWGGLTPRLWQADALPRLLGAFSRVELLDADPASNVICDPVSLPSSHAGVVYAGTLTLPAASVVGNDWFCQIRNGGSGAITIQGPGGETIDNISSLIMNPGASAFFVCDQFDFYTLGLGQPPGHDRRKTRGGPPARP